MDFLTIIYLFIGLFVLYLLYGQFKFVTIYCTWKTWTRGIIAVLAIVMLGLTFFTNNTVELIRNIGCTAVCALFALINDGISEQGISSNGTHFAWKEITGYDIHENEKHTLLLITFNMVDKKGNVSCGQAELKFDNKQKESVKTMVESHIKKKYRRMK